MAADYKMTIDEFVTMKNKLRAELERRGGGYGSVAEQLAIIDDIPTPTPGSGMLVSQGKIMDAFLGIKDLGDLRFCKKDDIIPKSFGPDMITAIDDLANETAHSSSCRGACTGLCNNSCFDNCSGCTGCSGCSSCTGSRR